MANLNNIFGELFDSVNNGVRAYSTDSIYMSESASLQVLGPQEEFRLQRLIRPCFGKKEVNTYAIGTHPDFLNLEGSNTTEQHYICTLFVDIKGSTRLSLLYPLEFVFKFKNAVIQTCIETIRAFDGCVHRIMGDAVMAFFGARATGKEDAIADAINCSVTLRSLLEQSIKPWLEEEKGFDAKDFGFRIGCDFGDDNEVLWGSFGYRNVGEISATGLPVDMASKLQSLASKNQTMLGQGLLDFINWPDKYARIKRKTIGGVAEDMPVVRPNITQENGLPLNYRMRELAYPQCLEFSALPRSFREGISNSYVKDNSQISYKCFVINSGNKYEYISASKFLEPEVSLLFEVSAFTTNRLAFPLKVSFRKTNHGIATPEEERGIEQSAEIRYIHKNRIGQYNRSIAKVLKVELNEATLYRGLHTMKCEVFDADQTLVFRDWIGVMIR